MFKKTTRWLIIGTLSVLPFLIIGKVVLFFESVMNTTISNVNNLTNDRMITFGFIFISILMLMAMGYSIEKYGKSMIISFFERIVTRIPLISSLHNILKKVIDMFSPKEGEEKREVVFVEYPRRGLWVPAYVTNKNKERKLKVLFVPTSPNPTSGFTIICSENELVKTKMNMEEATTFIISIGVDLKRDIIYNEIYNIEKDRKDYI